MHSRPRSRYPHLPAEMPHRPTRSRTISVCHRRLCKGAGLLVVCQRAAVQHHASLITADNKRLLASSTFRGTEVTVFAKHYMARIEDVRALVCPPAISECVQHLPIDCSFPLMCLLVSRTADVHGHSLKERGARSRDRETEEHLLSSLIDDPLHAHVVGLHP